MRRNKKIFLAEMLLEKNLISKAQLDAAIEQQKETDKKIGQILVDLGYIEEHKLLLLLAEQLKIQYIDLKAFPLNPELVKLLPEFHARHFRSIVLSDLESSYLVGMVDPQDLLAHDELERLLQRKITLALIREDDLLFVLDNIYRRSEEISHFAETLSAELSPAHLVQTSEKADLSSEDMPIVNLLRSIFEDAAQVNASDIHIEPDEKVLRIRLRVDGVLQEQIIEEKSIAQALVQRIKMISSLNIAEKRLPQDGRFSITVKNKHFDVRVSTLPIQFGESVVMRLLNQSGNVLKLDQIGMPKKIYTHFNSILQSSYGIILIVGPTGSGKTTTLYAALNDLNKAADKIITVEDPVEFRLSRINQVQVNPKIDLTFANILRSILRQDPDIIMIGELRDKETVEISMRAAMTGHLVLGTLHTNDTISCATRLLDMGAEGYLVASVLRGILAQRLVRKICQHCKVEIEITAQEKVWLESQGYTDFSNYKFYKGSGCTHCHQAGYAGRVGVFELLIITETLAETLRQGNTSEFQERAKKEPIYHSLAHTAIDLALDGQTTMPEVIRMSGEL